jgi:hypothetical protein
MGFVIYGGGHGRRWQVRGGHFHLNSWANKEVEKLTTGVVNCPASFLPVRLLLLEGVAWGMGFVMYGGGHGRRWQVRGSHFHLNSWANKKIAKLTMGVINCPASYFAC